MGIRLLDRDTIDKITAGEVVERPVSVVKELVENSIDAGATGITVEIRDGGLTSIRVTDNGCGIAAGEVKMAFESHATSKLENAEGLTDIRTMGFRGEALPSIASVGKVTLTTKTRSADMGVRVSINGGVIENISPAGCPDGTTITVNELFYNIPVRRTFLKKPAYEQSLISELMQKLALGNPKISFRFISSGKTLMQTGGSGDLRHAAAAVYGGEYAQSLIEVKESEGAFELKGFIGVEEQAAPTRARQFFYLNGRLINCRMLSQAVEEACRGRVTIGRYPSCILFVNTPAVNVDVNVHPSKLEVRFRDEAAFKLTAQTLLKRGLASGNMMEKVLAAPLPQQEKPALRFEPRKEAEKPLQTGFEYLRTFGAANEMPAKAPRDMVRETPVSVRISPLAAPDGKPESPVREAEGKPELKTREAEKQSPIPQPENTAEEPSYRLIGSFLNTYILLEYKENLIIIDQHAAHERLNYEKYVRSLDEGVLSQPLLVPIVLEVTPREASILEESLELLNEAGYEAELFGGSTVKVTSVPFIYGSSDMKLLFTDLIDNLELLKHAEKQRRLDAVIQASCKHAVKGGEKLTQDEINALLKSMSDTEASPTCPHGRPVMKVFTRRGIEQLFKRIQ